MWQKNLTVLGGALFLLSACGGSPPPPSQGAAPPAAPAALQAPDPARVAELKASLDGVLALCAQDGATAAQGRVSELQQQLEGFLKKPETQAMPFRSNVERIAKILSETNGQPTASQKAELQREVQSVLKELGLQGTTTSGSDAAAAPPPPAPGGPGGPGGPGPGGPGPGGPGPGPGGPGPRAPGPGPGGPGPPR